MFNMSISTKQVFLAGLLTWVLTIGTGILSYVKTQENQKVRITTMEYEVIQLKLLLPQVTSLNERVDEHTKKIDGLAVWLVKLGDTIAINREDSVRVIEALDSVSKSQAQLVNVTESLHNEVIRLKTISEVATK